MDSVTIKSLLRDKVGIKKEIVALKQMKKEPSSIEEYQGRNNICFMMGEVLKEGKTFYTTLKNRMCPLGCVATGLDASLPKLSNEELQKRVRFPVETINTFQSTSIQAKAEKAADSLFPQFKDLYKAIIMGPIESVSEPDLFAIICTPEQVHLLTRAYCYVTGKFIKGYAGIGACRIMLPYPFLTKEPTYSVSDRTWRIALNLSADELTLITPPDKLTIMLENLEQSKIGGPTSEVLKQVQ